MMKNHNIIHTFFIALFLFSMPILANSNQDYIDEYRSEIDQFIKNSDLYNKEISKLNYMQLYAIEMIISFILSLIIIFFPKKIRKKY